MKILSIEFTPNWSWGLIFNELQKKASSDIKFNRIFVNFNHNNINSIGIDVMFAQNVTLLKKFTERLRTVCRMGGNQNFEDGRNIQPILDEMSKCYCIIATNQKLYDIATAVNDRVYLLPNGIDLDEWNVCYQEQERFTVGFCGNISTAQYKDYKGYDYLYPATLEAGVDIKEALYQFNQIPHDQMREKFYSQIDCLVHPTLGEGCSNTLMEACTCGIPIITTREAGFHGEQMIDGENVLFCERSIKSIKEKILMLKNDKALRKKLSNGARKFALKHHDINVIAKRYEEIFNECHEANKALPPKIRIISMVNSPNCTIVYSINNQKPEMKCFPCWMEEKAAKEIILNEYQNRELING